MGKDPVVGNDLVIRRDLVMRKDPDVSKVTGMKNAFGIDDGVIIKVCVVSLGMLSFMIYKVSLHSPVLPALSTAATETAYMAPAGPPVSLVMVTLVTLADDGALAFVLIR